MAQAGTATNINKEPVWVVWNDTNLGYIDEGDAVVRITPSYEMQTTHQTGVSPIEAYFNGYTVEVEVSFAEVDNWDLWPIAFLFGEKQADTDTTPNNRFVGHQIADVANSQFVGQKVATVSKQLELKPVRGYTAANTEYLHDWVFPKAFCTNVGDIPFSSTSNNVAPLTFSALLDPTDTAGAGMFWRGLETEVSGSWAAA